jgi:beta-lactamase class A
LDLREKSRHGKRLSLRADEQVRTASTIKLPIMTEVFRQVAQGKINGRTNSF